MRSVNPTLPLAAAALLLIAGPASGQRAERGWIGISLDIPTLDGAVGRNADIVIGEVRRGSPAEEAGLRAGDRLLAIGDLRTPDEFRTLPERLRLRVGDRVRVRVERDGHRIDVALRAAERPDDVRSRTIMLAMESEAMVEDMVRAMDSLRIQLVRHRDDARNPAQSVTRVDPDPRSRSRGFSAPFEFFLFRGEEHDSLEQAMEDLNRMTRELQRQEELRVAELRAATARRDNAAQTDERLATVRAALEEVTRRSAELRTAMSEAARITAGLDVIPSGPPAPETPYIVRLDGQTPFSPLTPYLLGSNMVAGAQVVDLRPELARYFDVEGGVLIVDVAPRTPAAIAGIVPGDVITRLDQVTVRSVDDLRFGVSQSGDSLPISLVRQGSTLEVLLTRR